MATRPARQPLQAASISALPVRANFQYMATIAPVAAARKVFTVMTEIRSSVAASVLPALKPNQPKNRIKVPMTT